MKTSTKENGLEVKVGLFLCIGVAIIGAMVLEFSLGGKQGFKKYDTLSVDMPDASGLLKGSDVLLAGSSVGYVADKPTLSSNLTTVRVTVKVDEKVKIPIGASFKVASSGLLGDKFVAVQMSTNFDPSKFNPNDPKQVYQSVDPSKPNLNAKTYDPDDKKQNDPDHPELGYQPGDVILGERSKDITEIAADASKKLNAALDNFQEITTNLKTGVLSPESLKNLQDTVVSLKITGQNWADASKKLPGIATGAQEAVDKANQTMETAKGAAADLQKTLQNIRGLIQKASEGQGLIGQLLTNRQLADNFNALVVNLREHGVLFYRNSSSGETPAPSQTPARDRKRQ